MSAIPVRAAQPEPAALPSVLIVDDSVVARTVMARTIEQSGRFVVAGAVPDVRAALAFLQDRLVDGILLDIEMPGIDGLTALPDLIAAGGGAKVLIVSSSATEGAANAVQALALGAADTLVKPGAGALAGRFAVQLRDKLSRLFGSEPDDATLPQLPPRELTSDFDIVGIGASTGGIHALGQLLRAIPASCRLPILITQHLPASFMPYFAAQVAVLAGRPCDVADDRMRIRSGRVIVAPGHAHMRCVTTGEGAAIRLSTEPSRSGCLPSVDPMFESMATAFGARALGVVLSGMGRDGADGARQLAAAGGGIIAQDRESSVIWGMPGAVVADGLAAAVLPPDEIGRVVARRRRPSC
jgi:two-component system chemotaxis response regulator CheB